MRYGRPMIDDLVKRFFLVGLTKVKDVDEAVGTRGEKERGKVRMKLQICHGIGVGFHEFEDRF